MNFPKCSSTALVLIFSCLVQGSYADDSSASCSSLSIENKVSHNSNSSMNIQEFATKIERDLKQKVIVSSRDASSQISVNVGKEPLTLNQVLSQLYINGYTAIKSKDYLEIVPARDARELAIPILDKRKSYLDDEMVTDFIKPKKVCAAKIMASIRALVPQYGYLAANEDANTLIIVDTFRNIQRIHNVVETLEDNVSGVQECPAGKLTK